MATIDHDAKTVSTVCQLDDEAGVRVALQEILDDNPGYKPILIVEDANGKETTYTSLSAPVKDEVAEVAGPIEEPAEVVAEEPATEEEAVEEATDEETVEEESPDEESTDEETAEEEEG